MNVREGKLNKLFNWVYVIMGTNALWVLGFVLGLGVFAIVPSTITIIDIYQQFSHPRKRDRLKMWRFWKEHFFKYLKKYWFTSFLFSLLFFVLFINYGYLNMASGLLSYLLFYITIFLVFIFFFVWLWFCYIRSYFTEVSIKETLVNAIAYTVSHFFEMLILFVLLVAAVLLIWEITPGLVVFTGIGGSFAAIHTVFTLIQNGTNLRTLTKGMWDRIF